MNLPRDLIAYMSYVPDFLLYFDDCEANGAKYILYTFLGKEVGCAGWYLWREDLYVSAVICHRRLDEA